MQSWHGTVRKVFQNEYVKPRKGKVIRRCRQGMTIATYDSIKPSRQGKGTIKVMKNRWKKQYVRLMKWMSGESENGLNEGIRKNTTYFKPRSLHEMKIIIDIGHIYHNKYSYQEKVKIVDVSIKTQSNNKRIS